MIKALNYRVVVEPFAAEDVSEGGIIIPDSAKEAAVDGIVRSVWEPTTKDHEERRYPWVKEGDHVAFPKYSGTEIVIEDRKYRVLLEEDLFGVFDE